MIHFLLCYQPGCVLSIILAWFSKTDDSPQKERLGVCLTHQQTPFSQNSCARNQIIHILIPSKVYFATAAFLVDILKHTRMDIIDIKIVYLLPWQKR